MFTQKYGIFDIHFIPVLKGMYQSKRFHEKVI